jgi:acetyltransferase-like isoleucine patch superfamily enzyme
MASTYPFREKCGAIDYPTGIPDEIAKPITIGSDCWIGYGASIVRSVDIGHGAIIGARAVVAGDIQPYGIVVGNPGRVIKYRYSEDIMRDLLRIQWWSWSHEKIMDNLHLIRNVKDLIQHWKEGKV